MDDNPGSTQPPLIDAIQQRVTDLEKGMDDSTSRRIFQQNIAPGVIKPRHLSQGIVLKLVDNSQDYQSQFGTANISLSTAVHNTLAITFSSAFANACSQVILTVQDTTTNTASKYVVAATLRTKSGFTLDLSYWPNSNTTDTITVAWLAIGY